MPHLLSSAPCLPSPPTPFPEADDLAQYLDHLLAHATPRKPRRPAEGGGGLGRFKALASKTKEMVALKSKAEGLDVHGEGAPPALLGRWGRLPQEAAAAPPPCAFCPDANMYLSNKLFRSAQPALSLNLPDASTPPDAQVRGGPPFPPPSSSPLSLSALQRSRRASRRRRRCGSARRAASPETRAEPWTTAPWPSC